MNGCAPSLAFIGGSRQFGNGLFFDRSMPNADWGWKRNGGAGKLSFDATVLLWCRGLILQITSYFLVCV